MTSCDDIVSAAAEYGTPHADFSVSGKVVGEEGRLLKGIRVVLTNPGGYQSAADTTYTASDGKYMLDYHGIFPFHDPTLTIEAADVDGGENGQYKKKVVKFAPKPFNGGDGWYEGESHNTVDFKLTAGVDEDESEDGGGETDPD